MKNLNNLKKCYLIAEIGVNHNGDLNLAKKMKRTNFHIYGEIKTASNSLKSSFVMNAERIDTYLNQL